MSFGPQRLEELSKLIDALIEQCLTDADAARLEQIVCSDDEAAEFYWSYCNLHGLMCMRGQGLGPVNVLDQLASANPPLPGSAATKSIAEAKYHGVAGTLFSLSKKAIHTIRHPTPLSLITAALVIGVLITAMAFMVPPFYTAIAHRNGQYHADPFRIVAKLTGVHEPIWGNGQARPRLLAAMRIGHRVQLRGGLAEVTFENGAVVVIQGPAVFTVASDNGGTLEVGRIVCEVTPAAHGFTVQTPTARLVDLGTEFAVAVDVSGATDVYVVQGSVEASVLGHAHGGSAARRLAAGRSLHVTAEGFTASSVGVADFARRDALPSFVQSDWERLDVAAYEYLVAPRADHVGNNWPDSLDGQRELINRRFASKDYHDPQWVGFTDIPDSGAPQPQITFDLRRICELEGLTIAYLHSADVPDAQAGGTVTAPDEVRISVSDDGRDFSSPQLLPALDASPGNGLRVARRPLAALRGRYVRLDFRQKTQWTFLCEVAFYGSAIDGSFEGDAAGGEKPASP